MTTIVPEHRAMREKLLNAHARVKAAEDSAHLMRRRRADVVCEAVSAGWSRREISQLLRVDTQTVTWWLRRASW